MENGTTERDLIDDRQSPLVGLSQFTESVALFENALKELHDVKVDRERLRERVARLEAQLDEANTVAANAHEQLRQERGKIGDVIMQVTKDADQRVEEANSRANVEIANRAALEAFVSGIRAQVEAFELPAEPLATNKKPNGRKKITATEAAAKNKDEPSHADKVVEAMKETIASEIGLGEVRISGANSPTS